MDDFTTRVSLAKIVKDNGLKEEYMPDEPEKIMISLSDVNRPGLVLAAGFYDHFEPKRIQVLGNAETMYLKKLPEELRSERLTDFFWVIDKIQDHCRVFASLCTVQTGKRLHRIGSAQLLINKHSLQQWLIKTCLELVCDNQDAVLGHLKCFRNRKVAF